MCDIDTLLISFELPLASFQSCSASNTLFTSHINTINVGNVIKGISNQRRYIASFMLLHKKWSFPLGTSSVNVTKSAGNCEFGHI